MRKIVNLVGSVVLGLVLSAFLTAFGNAAITDGTFRSSLVVSGVVTSGTFSGNGSGITGWTAVPSGALLMTSGSCPGASTEDTTFRGRYLVGLVASGTAGATVGTALTDQEVRAAGQHNHSATTTVTDPGHNHTATSSISPNPHTHPDWDARSFSSGFQPGWLTGGSTALGTTSLSATTTVTSATTGISVTTTLTNAGSVISTNLPYIQMRYCLQP